MNARQNASAGKTNKIRREAYNLRLLGEFFEEKLFLPFLEGFFFTLL
jgi:hypothetical protein